MMQVDHSIALASKCQDDINSSKRCSVFELLTEDAHRRVQSKNERSNEVTQKIKRQYVEHEGDRMVLKSQKIIK